MFFRIIGEILLGEKWCQHDLPLYVTYINSTTVELRYKGHYYGRFHSIVEAVMERDRLINLGWPRNDPVKICKQNLPKYIFYTGSFFIIEKKIKGYNYNFGQFKTLKSALDERDKLIMCCWDYDAMESLDERVDGEIIWLGCKVYV